MKDNSKPAAIRFTAKKAHIHQRFLTILNEVSRERGRRVYAVDFVAELLDRWEKIEEVKPYGLEWKEKNETE